jgi:hypothetical protein
MQNIESKIRIDRGYISQEEIRQDMGSILLVALKLSLPAAGKVARSIEAQIEDPVGDQIYLIQTQLWDYLWDLGIIKFD